MTINRANLWGMLAVALCTVMGIQIVRVYFVLVINNFVERHGFEVTGLVTAGVALAPLIAPLLVRIIGAKRALWLAVAVLVGVRLLMQVALESYTLGPLLVIVGVMSAIIVWMLWMTRTAGSVFAIGLLLGFAVDTALMTAFLTWDYVWQPGIVPLALSLVVGALPLLALWFLRHAEAETEPTHDVNWRAALILPYMMLQMVMFQNLGFVISASGLPLPFASGLTLFINALVILSIIRFPQKTWPFVICAAACAAIFLVMICALYATGVPFMLTLLVGHLLGGFIVIMALSGEAKSGQTLLLTALILTVGAVLFALVGMGYFAIQIVPLPINNLIASVLCGLVLLGVIVCTRQWQSASESSQQLAAFRFIPVFPLALLIVPLTVLFLIPAPQPQAKTDNTVRLFNYNVRYGVSAYGMLNLEDFA